MLQPTPGDTVTLDDPEGVTVRGGMIWVVDTHNHRVLRFRWEGLEGRE